MSASRVRAAVAAGLLGTATGLRSTSGSAALVVGLHPERLPGPLRRPVARPAALLLAAGELIADKLPIPARTDPPGLALRAALSAGDGYVASRIGGTSPPVLAGVSASGALVAAFAGAGMRRRHPALAAALAEDLTAIGLAALAVGLLRSITPPSEDGPARG